MEDRLPAVLKLEEESRSLREFHVLDIEVPGQYFNDQVKVGRAMVLHLVNINQVRNNQVRWSLTKLVSFERLERGCRTWRKC